MVCFRTISNATLPYPTVPKGHCYYLPQFVQGNNILQLIITITGKHADLRHEN
jgi:hypothetical protein